MTTAADSKSDSARAQVRAYPISRWYVLPVTSRLAAWLCPTRIRPSHVTCTGLLLGLTATGLLLSHPRATLPAAALILAAWFMDRTDGLLARSQNTSSPLGAWLDANVDEVHEVAWHTAVAGAAASLNDSLVPWLLLVAFLGGKYLFMTGLVEERTLAPEAAIESSGAPVGGFRGWLRAAYHLPGNADIRLHLLIVCLASGLLTLELALIAVYYNFRWIVRFGLVARRLEGCQ